MDIVDSERAEPSASGAPNGAGRNGAGDQSSTNAAATNAESTSAASPSSQRDVEIDVHTDESPNPPAVAVRAAGPRGPASQSGVGPSGAISRAPAEVGEDGTIEVSDDEIEAADPSLSRASLPPPPSSSGGLMRSRPPAPPSSRPRSPGSASLPPPRHLVGASIRPNGVDPWLLANKTLELSHAQARIAELEEQLAFRDARIVELEESLSKARRKLDDLEARSRPSTGAAVAAAGLASSTAAPSAASSSPAASSPAAASSPVDGGAVAAEAALPAASSSQPAADDDDDDATFGDDEGESSFEGVSAIVRDGAEDDLQQISGIGPRFEAALRKHGITRLSQIAAWSDADVRQVAKALKIPKSRIVKGRWVEVAREVIGTRAASE